MEAWLQDSVGELVWWLTFAVKWHIIIYLINVFLIYAGSVFDALFGDRDEVRR